MGNYVPYETIICLPKYIYIIWDNSTFSLNIQSKHDPVSNYLMHVLSTRKHEMTKSNIFSRLMYVILKCPVSGINWELT